jgi:phosphate acetyltransferase
MKGSLHTDELMKALASRTARLLTPRRVRVKRDITQNAIDCAHATGIVTPNVAVISAIETVSDAIPSTVDAAALRDMAERGEIVGGIVEGPLAFDKAISAPAARIKGIETRVAGKVDILIVPGIEAGNILYKSLVYLSDAIAAGVVMGLRAPVVLTSRADTPREPRCFCSGGVPARASQHAGYERSVICRNESRP